MPDERFPISGETGLVGLRPECADRARKIGRSIERKEAPVEQLTEDREEHISLKDGNRY